MPKKLDYLALLLFCALIFWLSNQSKLPTPEWFENEDKLHHFLAYGVMGVLSWRAWRHLPFKRHTILWLSFGFCSLYGISDEIHQIFVIGRTPSVIDWLADSTGAFITVCLYYWRSKPAAKLQPLSGQS